MSLTTSFALLVTEKLQPTSRFSSKLRVFTLVKAIPMKLEFYIDHIIDQLQMNESFLPPCYLILEGLFDELNSLNVQKVVFTALVLVYKAFTDSPAKNSSLEKIGLVKTGELAKLELALLELLDWNLHYEGVESACKTIESFGNALKAEDEYEDYETSCTEYESNENLSEFDDFFRALR